MKKKNLWFSRINFAFFCCPEWRQCYRRAVTAMTERCCLLTKCGVRFKLGFKNSDNEHSSKTETCLSLFQICPICAALPGGDPNHVTDDFTAHLTLEHRAPRDLISFLGPYTLVTTWRCVYVYCWNVHKNIDTIRRDTLLHLTLTVPFYDESSSVRHVRRMFHPGRGLGGPRARRTNMHFTSGSTGGLSSSSSQSSTYTPSNREAMDPIAGENQGRLYSSHRWLTQLHQNQMGRTGSSTSMFHGVVCKFESYHVYTIISYGITVVFLFLQGSSVLSFEIMTYLETANSEACFCCVSCRVAVSAVRCAACSRGANKLVRAFSVPAPAAPDATAVGAAAGSGSTTASGDGAPCDTTQQQPRQHWHHHPSTQHSNCQHCHCGR